LQFTATLIRRSEVIELLMIELRLPQNEWSWNLESANTTITRMQETRDTFALSNLGTVTNRTLSIHQHEIVFIKQSVCNCEINW